MSAASGRARPRDASDDGRGGEPFVLALAGVHVEVEAAYAPAAIEDVEDGNVGVPGGGGGGAELYFEEAGGGLKDSGFDLRVGEIGADGLRVEVEGGAAELLIPVAAAGDVDGLDAGLVLAGEVHDEFMFAEGAIATGLVELGKEGADICGRSHHLVCRGQICPTAETEDGGDLLAGGEQVKQDLLVCGVGARVVGQKHTFAQRRIGGEGHDRLHVGLVGGEGDNALRIGRVAGEVVGGQAIEFGFGGLDCLAALLNVAAELKR